MRSISHLRRAALVLAALAVATIGLTACDPNDPAHVRAFLDLNPDVPAEELTVGTMNEAQRAVVKALQDRQTAFYVGVQRAQEQAFYEGIVRSQDSGDCYAEMREVFPASTWSWATSIIRRESGGNPAAANPSSTARGCFQLLSSLHAGRYAAVGCHVSQWASAHCNVRAAHQLYLAAGTSPWNL
jgi:hypothetical protein